MKLSFRLVFICLFIFIDSSLLSNELYFVNINGDSGLSESNVKAITQDSFGFIWFGTRNGLNRYDGRKIRVFDIRDNKTGRNNTNVGVLLEDDNKQLWVGTDIGIFIFDPITEQFHFFSKKIGKGKFLDNWVSDIKKDKKGNIWIVIPSQGVFKYLPTEDKLLEYKISSDANSKKSPQCIFISKDGQVWIGSNGVGLFRYNEQQDKFIQYLRDKSGNSLENQNIYTLCEYRGRLVLGIHEGKLLQWNLKSNSLTPFNISEIDYKIIRKVVSYDDKNLFIATQAGLFVYNEIEGRITNYHEDDLNPYSLSDNTIYSIYRDREEGIWVGTLLGGANYAAKRNIEFKKYIPGLHINSLSTKKIRELVEDKNGNIWIGSENGGVNIFDTKKKTFHVLDKSKSKYTNLALFYDNDRMFIGYFKRELDVVDLSSNNIQHLTAKELGITEESVCALFKDSEGKYWLGDANQVNLSQTADFKFTPRPDIANGYVYDIKEDRDGNIWFATLGTGVYRYNPKTQIKKRYSHSDDNNNSLSSNTVSSITIDMRGVVWFSTDRGGICCYNKNSDNFTTYSIKDGLPDNVAYKILVDKYNNLWFGTNKGLVKFNPSNKSVRIFTKSDGLLGNQFSYKSALISKDGTFYFGGIDGLISLNPYYKIKNKVAPPVYITTLYVYNKEVSVGEAGSPLKKSLLNTTKIKFDYKSSNINVDFAVLSYTAPAANIFAYKMEGIDIDWIYTHNHSAYYSQLPPGDYTFRVKAANNDGVWNNTGTELQIIILPPWWKSTVAYFIYWLIALFIIFYSFKYYSQKRERKVLQTQKLFEIKKEQELYRAKVDFFTSIAHEIKTPLSLIKGPLEEINKREVQDGFIKKSLQIMELNTNRLLTLINQLLDFRKIDSNKITLYFTNENINNLLQETVLRFEQSIVLNKKEIAVELPEKELFAPIDKEEFTKIISNLLNNALKYSAHSIQVILSKGQSSFSIQVISDGKTIPFNLREKIFEPFYQLHNEREMVSGVGIGLSLASSLAELHSGNLRLVITDEGKNNFVATFPLQQDNVINISAKEESGKKISKIENEGALNGKELKYTIMIVDDNFEILEFLSEGLCVKFIVITAINGKDAIDKLKQNTVHLIISDVMMPVMDGLELCNFVKNDIEYSHIPLILLTAKNDIDSKIKGLESGADAYLEKPFSFDYLVAQATNLLINREKERNAFAKRPFFPVYNLKMNKADEEFMNKVLKQIQANIADENFNVERLAKLLAMSRSVLHRKIKNLVDMAPVDFIRVIRLKQAAELIQTGKYSMAEVSVMIGINSPSYFSKLFLKQFGITPKSFYKKYNEDAKIDAKLLPSGDKSQIIN